MLGFVQAPLAFPAAGARYGVLHHVDAARRGSPSARRPVAAAPIVASADEPKVGFAATVQRVAFALAVTGVTFCAAPVFAEPPPIPLYGHVDINQSAEKIRIRACGFSNITDADSCVTRVVLPEAKTGGCDEACTQGCRQSVLAHADKSASLGRAPIPPYDRIQSFQACKTRCMEACDKATVGGAEVDWVPPS